MVNKDKIPAFLERFKKKKEESRYTNIMYAIVCVLCVLGARLFWMQIIEGSYYKSEADGNRIRHLPVQAARGVMFDRNGQIMAGSRSAYSVVLPDDFKKNKISDAELNRLSQLIQMPVADIKQKIEDNKKAFGGLVIANDVGIDVATQIEERRDDYPNFIIEVRPLRVYPLNDAGGQILGYVGEAGPNDKDAEGNPYQLGTIIGRAGLEAEFNPYLEGKNGNKLVEVDASGRPVKTFDGIPVSQGHNIRLTLDSRIQRAAEDAIKEQMAKLGSTSSFATGASAVAMDPQTGAILAMVSWPSYDSNHFSQGITAAEWKNLINNPNHPMQNRTISSVYPPGSTFKVITASAALESHVTTPGERIFDSGKHWLIPKRNAQGEAFGWINFYDAMAKSDNVYFYEMGRRLGIDRLSAMARAYGIGRKTGIDLPNETRGLVYGTDMGSSTLATNSFGQNFTVNMIQMVSGFSSLINGGYYYEPRVVKQVVTSDDQLVKNYSKTLVKQTITKETSDYIKECLRSVVTDGTGSTAAINGYTVGGKTGTAEKVDTSGKGKGRLKNQYILSFLGCVPCEDPQVVCYTLMDTPKKDPQATAYNTELWTDVMKQVLPYLGVEKTEKIEKKAKKQNLETEFYSDGIIEGDDGSLVKKSKED